MGWPSGKARACKAHIPGSIPGAASSFLNGSLANGREGPFMLYFLLRSAGVAELVDAADLKSVDRKVVGVQVPLRAPSLIPCK